MSLSKMVIKFKRSILAVVWPMIKAWPIREELTIGWQMGKEPRRLERCDNVCLSSTYSRIPWVHGEF